VPLVGLKQEAVVAELRSAMLAARRASGGRMLRLVLLRPITATAPMSPCRGCASLRADAKD